MPFFRLTRIFYSDWSLRFSIFFRIVRIEMMTRVYMSGQIAKSDICASPKPPPEFDKNGHPTHKIALFVRSLVDNVRDAKSSRCSRYICAIFFQLVLIFGPFWIIFGPFWQFWVIFGPIWSILGHFWAILGNFRSFLGHFLVLIFCGKILLCAI